MLRQYSRSSAPFAALMILLFGTASVHAQSSAPMSPAHAPAAATPKLSSKPPTATVTALYNKENTAITAGNYAQFVAAGTPTFQQSLTKELFTTACANISANLKSGYTSKYMGQRPVQDNTAYFWDLTCKNGVKYTVILGILGGNVSACLYHVGPAS